MIPRLANRTPPMRPLPGSTGEPRLASLAAAFALLTQRRSLAIQHIQMLDQQRSAAVTGLARLHKRIAWLMQRIDALGPDLRDPAEVTARDPPHERTGQPMQPRPTLIAAHSAEALAAIGREWVAAQPSQPDHPARPRWARRT